MKPVDFEQKNFNLGAPRGMEKEIGGMPCWKGEISGDPYIISCWKLSPEEIEMIKTTGTVWLYINGYNTFPLSMQVNNPFKDEGKHTLTNTKTQGGSIEMDERKDTEKNEEGLTEASLCISVENGKYEIVQLKNGSTYAKRYGEYWRDLTGDKLIGALVDKLEDAKVLISSAAPLAWATGNYDDAAYEWEKKAKDFLET